MHRAALGTVTATAALAAVLALTSCSDSSTGGADTASQPSLESSAEASAGATGPGGATATPAQPADFAGTAHVTDADNYTFDITYSYRTTGVQRDTANDKPGFSSALIKTNAELTVTNTTSGRTLSFKPVSGIVAPFGDPQLQVLAYFNPGRAVCSLETVNSFLATKEKAQAGCTVQLNFARPSTTLTAGGKDTPEVFRGLQNGQGTAAWQPCRTPSGPRSRPSCVRPTTSSLRTSEPTPTGSRAMSAPRRCPSSPRSSSARSPAAST